MTRTLTEVQQAKILESIPMGRVGAPAEVGALAAFLASQSAAYITGQTIHVNGGMLMV